MPPSLNQSESRITWRTLLFVAVGGLLVFSLLTQKMSSKLRVSKSTGQKLAKGRSSGDVGKRTPAAPKSRTSHDESPDRNSAPAVEYVPQPSSGQAIKIYAPRDFAIPPRLAGGETCRATAMTP
jgi:hypothetical protein